MLIKGQLSSLNYCFYRYPSSDKQAQSRPCFWGKFKRFCKLPGAAFTQARRAALSFHPRASLPRGFAPGFSGTLFKI